MSRRADPLNAETLRSLAKLLQKYPHMRLSAAIAKAAADAKVNQLRAEIGYRRRPSALDRAAGIGEGLIYG
jgi:hypothetical protein